ncbi:MAG: Na/Pi cotransporter family protein, partial [Peptococcaceae bacterium]|nr:Na/Pi cotransporter family protein [Peptococcaceae bacterium]
HMASDALEYAIDYYLLRGEDDKTEALRREETVDMLEQAITNYVVEVTHNHDLDHILSERSYTILQAVGDLERIGDHAENLVELTDYCMVNKIEISDEANDGLREMMETVQQAVSNSLLALRNNNALLAREVIDMDDEVDRMEADLRKGHITRLNAGACSATAGAAYLDMLSNLERIGDHAVNIAQIVLEREKTEKK